MISKVQSAHGDHGLSAGAVTITFPSSNTAGNTLIVMARWAGGSSNVTMAVTDSQGNTYSVLRSRDNAPHDNLGSAGGAFQQSWIVFSCNAGSNVVTLTPSGNVFSMFAIAEYSGLSAGAIDQSNFGQDGGTASTALNSGSITTTQASELIIAYGGSEDGPGSFTAGTGWTIQEQQNDSSLGQCMFYEDRLESSTGTFTGQATMSVSQHWGISVVSISASSSPPAATQPILIVMM
jgi:hypothetical protein